MKIKIKLKNVITWLLKPDLADSFGASETRAILSKTITLLLFLEANEFCICRNLIRG
jgi:hypothetical protein